MRARQLIPPAFTSAALESIAIDTAKRAALLVTQRFGNVTALHTKSSATDVVTQTDVDAEVLIRALLSAATPGCGFVGEEGGTTGTDARLQWVVDPLDGTVNYLYGLPVFAVSIAAALDGEFVAGAVVDALRGETFSAFLGGGARIDGEAITASGVDTLAASLIGTGFSYSAPLHRDKG